MGKQSKRHVLLRGVKRAFFNKQKTVNDSKTVHRYAVKCMKMKFLNLTFTLHRPFLLG